MGKWMHDIPMHGDKIRVRIRGVYSTALTKFFLDNNFEITQPSEILIKRFNFENTLFLSPHIDIQTKGSKAIIESVERATERLKDILLNSFNDIVIYQIPVSKNSIWRGVVTKKVKDGYLVRFSLNMEGFLPAGNALQEYREGDLVVVEVSSYDQKSGRILLTDSISIPGEFVVLVKKEIVKVSRKIRGQKKVELLDLGNILRPAGWGAIFRTSAMYADIDDISKELNSLKDYAEQLLKDIDKVPAFTQIREGIHILHAYFGHNTKKKLDSLRAEVFPTLTNHHWLKTLGKSTSFLVDFIENNLIDRYNIDVAEMSKLITNFVKNTILPKKGDTIRIHHIKPNLKLVVLGPAKIVDVHEEDGQLEYYMFRRFSPGGYYDGINAPKESGDYGITIAREGDTKLITAYFDMNSNLKGIYININSPIEVYKKTIRYVDYEIDVVRTFDGEFMIIDRQKLEKYLEQKAISKELYDLAQTLAEEYRNWLENKGQDLILSKCEDIRDLIEEELIE